MLTYSCKPHPQFPLFRRLRLALFIGCFLLGQTCIAQNFAYVTNSGSGTVSVIDTTTDTVTATVSVGSRPFGVAANSTRVYVTNSGSNDVSVIDTNNNTVVATIPVGLRPLGVAVNPQGTRAYVANSGSGSLSIIDASTNTVITTLINAGNAESPHTLQVRIDKTQPTVTCTVSPNVLWPPDHKVVTVNTSVTVTDSLSGPGTFQLFSVTNSELDSGQGDIAGWTIGLPSTVGQLRAMRLGAGSGRTYTLTYRGFDTADNSATCSVVVSVPHDQGAK
jgi:YVTN family beta-propeller protein